MFRLRIAPYILEKSQSRFSSRRGGGTCEIATFSDRKRRGRSGASKISPSMIAGGAVNPGAAADRIMQGLGKPESLQPGRAQATSRRASFSWGSVRYDDGQYY